VQVLDWRSRGERFLTSLWPNQLAGTRPDPGAGARMWASAHAWFVTRRVVRRPAPDGRPVIVSVGNLALGGTGKTPVVIGLAKDLAAQGQRGCVLTRGYRSPLTGPVTVQPDNLLAGDEARLLAGSLADVGWTVVQSRVRAAGLRHLRDSGLDPTVVLLEDGHQTAGVGRHLDVLILDSWSIQSHQGADQVVPLTGAVFPFGPWRESAAGAQRAAIWLLETTAEVPALGRWGSRIVTFSRAYSCRDVNSAATAVREPPQPALVSGIARPDKFEDGARNLLAAEPKLAVRLADHTTYGPRLVARVCRALAAAGCASLVTTEKDWIKLAAFWPADVPAFVIDLKIVWGKGETLPDLVRERF